MIHNFLYISADSIISISLTPLLYHTRRNDRTFQLLFNKINILSIFMIAWGPSSLRPLTPLFRDTKSILIEWSERLHLKLLASWIWYFKVLYWWYDIESFAEFGVVYKVINSAELSTPTIPVVCWVMIDKVRRWLNGRIVVKIMIICCFRLVTVDSSRYDSVRVIERS